MECDKKVSVTKSKIVKLWMSNIGFYMFDVTLLLIFIQSHHQSGEMNVKRNGNDHTVVTCTFFIYNFCKQLYSLNDK